MDEIVPSVKPINVEEACFMGTSREEEILVVDDTPQNLKLLRSQLMSLGFNVRFATDGPSALLSCQASLPDLILLDVNMPNGSGYEVCRELKSKLDTRDIPVIFLSAAKTTVNIVEGLTVGGVDYVSKPFHMEELTARIETHLKLRRLEKELQDWNGLLETRILEVSQELATIFEASQSLSEASSLQEITERLLAVAQKCLKAEKIVLVLHVPGVGWQVEGVRGGRVEVMHSCPCLMEAYPDLPHSIIKYVDSACETIVLKGSDEMLAGSPDPYFRNEVPHSVICLPLIHAKQCVGVLYSENIGLTPSQIQTRLKILQVVIAQALVSRANLTLLTVLNERFTSLKRAYSELEQFAFIASHDLQEPLRKVQVHSEFLLHRSQAGLTQEAHRWLNVILAGVRRMRVLIRDLRDFSAIRSQDGDSREVFDLKQCVQETVETFASQLHEVGGRVEVATLPEVVAHRAQVKQVFQQLLNNTIKFRSEKPLYVQISVSELSTDCLVVVRDNGIGLSMEYSEKVFEIFQQVDPQTEQEGTGIGLAICKKIIENHQGKIWVEAEPGEGSVFYFTIPHQSCRSELQIELAIVNV